MLRSRALLATLVLVTVAIANRAAADDTPIAVWLDAGAVDLDRRVEGQTTDLAWDFVRRPMPPDELSIEALFALGESEGARVVFAVTETEGAETLDVVDVRTRRRFTRRFEGGSATARREEAAVALRSSLVALALGGEIGVQVATAPPVPSELPRDEERPATPAQPPAQERRTRTDVDLAIAGEAAFDGLGGSPSLGLAARLGAERRRLAFGLVGSLDAPRGVGDADVAFSVTRSSLVARFGVTLLDRKVARLVAATGLGMLVLGRVTTRASDPLAATDRARTVVAFAPLELACSLFPGRARVVGVELAAGAAFAFGRPTFEVVQGDVRRTVASAWIAEPILRVGIVVRTDRGRARGGS